MVLTMLIGLDSGGPLVFWQVPGSCIEFLSQDEPSVIYKGISSHEDHGEFATVADHLESLRPSPSADPKKQEKPTNPNAMHIKEPKNKSRKM